MIGQPACIFTTARDNRWDRVAWSPHGNKIIAAKCTWDVLSGTSADIILFNPTDVTDRSEIVGAHREFIRALSFSPDGTRFASGSTDKTIAIWNVESMDLIHRFNLPAGVTSLSWSPDGKYIVAGDNARRDNGGGKIRVWDTGSGVLLHTIDENTGGVWAVSWSPDGTLLAAGSGSKEDRLSVNVLRVIKTDNWETVHTYEFEGWIHCISWSPDSTQIATCYHTKMALYNVVTGALASTEFNAYRSIPSVAWCPTDNERIAFVQIGVNTRISMVDTSMNLVWNIGRLDSPNQIALSPHPNQIAWSPDGTKIVSGNENGISCYDMQMWIFMYRHINWNSAVRNPVTYVINQHHATDFLRALKSYMKPYYKRLLPTNGSLTPLNEDLMCVVLSFIPHATPNLIEEQEPFDLLRLLRE